MYSLKEIGKFKIGHILFMFLEIPHLVAIQTIEPQFLTVSLLELFQLNVTDLFP